MDTSGFLEWLKGTLSTAENRTHRRILRFVHPGDDRLFLKALQAERPRSRTLGDIRRLSIIRAYSCPFPISRLPAAFGNRIVWEEDPIVSMHGPASGSAAAAASTRLRLRPRTRTRTRPLSRSLPKPRNTAAKSDTAQGIPWGIRRIRAPQAWSRTTGYRVKVGVIDTGVDFEHPDLRHSLERGINLLQRAMLPVDDNGHGTHIAGTLAAANQLQGMIGVAPRASIHPVKAFDANGTAFVSDIILGIDWCVRNRMDVVNMSFGMNTRSKSLLAAVSNAYQSGVLIVASSGNDGKRDAIDYPARYSQTIAVGATNRSGRVASFTNRGGAIDIYAPGEKVESCWLRGKRKIMSGTSMATSHVTGAIALLLGLKPGLGPEQIKAILRRSMRPLRYAKAPRTTGELDVMRMLQAADRLKE